MKVLILGGDGYLGWPTAMHLTAHGHEVVVADNYLRRRLCRELDIEPLFPVPNLHQRSRLWEEASGHKVPVYIGDLRSWDFMAEICRDFSPEALVHYAEQPSAPYSMLDRRAAALTVQNNLEVTLNTIFAVRKHCPGAHIVKLGTMGEYGTPNIDIEEGWIEIEHRGRKDKFLFPRQAGSLYHTTKIMDTDLLWFYVRTWGLRVTDLMQGPVYGLATDESGPDERLYPFFNYDEIFGTVVNRFMAQAAVGHPLTVFGKGGQTRGYLNIIDTLNCIRLSVENPADPGQLRVFNQFTELFSVTALAEKVQRVARGLGLTVEIRPIKNPRLEKEEHYYNPVHRGLLELGLTPHLMTDDVLAGMLETVMKYRQGIDQRKIIMNVLWK
ncbi:MAG: NAD-dependent epimerase/dehydratase family protein [Pseudomonadota bacterium]